MKRHKTRTTESLPTFRRGQVMSTVAACRKIKADFSAFRRNSAKKTAPISPTQ